MKTYGKIFKSWMLRVRLRDYECELQVENMELDA